MSFIDVQIQFVQHLENQLTVVVFSIILMQIEAIICQKK